MRELSVDERFSQIATIERQRHWFMINNTSPLATYESVSGAWMPVHAIRYEGITGTKNVWGL